MSNKTNKTVLGNEPVGRLPHATVGGSGRYKDNLSTINPPLPKVPQSKAPDRNNSPTGKVTPDGNFDLSKRG
jgi:hypothetical protein